MGTLAMFPSAADGMVCEAGYTGSARSGDGTIQGSKLSIEPSRQVAIKGSKSRLDRSF